MGGPDNFDLQIDGPGTYFSWQLIQGQVIITSSMEMSKIKNIQVKLEGFANVHWTERVI